jgi:hypothetical protein
MGQKLLCPLQRVHNVVPRGSVKLERIPYQFDRLLDRERVGGREGPEMTDDVHNPAVNW